MADNEKNPENDHDPREWEAGGGKRPLRPAPEFMADPDVQRQMDFNDFINTPEGEKWVLELMRKNQEDDTPSVMRNTRPPLEDMDLTAPEKRLESARRAIAKIAPRHSEELEADTD